MPKIKYIGYSEKGKYPLPCNMNNLYVSKQDDKIILLIKEAIKYLI